MNSLSKSKKRAPPSARPRGRYDPRLKNGNIPFGHAILRITGRTSQTKAMPAFKEMFRNHYEALYRALNSKLVIDPVIVEKILQSNLGLWRKRGFTPDEVPFFRSIYVKLPRRAPRWTKAKRTSIAEFHLAGRASKQKKGFGSTQKKPKKTKQEKSQPRP